MTSDRPREQHYMWLKRVKRRPHARVPIRTGLPALLLLLSCGGGAAGKTVSPSRAAAAGKESGTQLILLGTGGGPIVRTKRSEPANLLVVHGRRYLIDAGAGTIHRLKQAGYEAAQVDHLFFTHLHWDHTGDLSSLLLLNWLAGARRAVNIWGPPGTTDLVAGALRYLQLNEALYAAILPPGPGIAKLTRAHEAIAGAARVLIFQDDLVKVYAAENTHYTTVPVADRTGAETKSYSLRFETPERVIVFTGDTGPSQAVADLARGADLLVSEVASIEATGAFFKQTRPGMSDEQLKPLLEHTRSEHLTPQAVGELARNAAVKSVVLTHVAPGLDTENDDRIYTSGVQENYRGPVTVGKDLGEY